MFNNIPDKELTADTLTAAGYYKVELTGGSLISAIFFNPATKEIKHIIVRDYDYEKDVKDNDELYFLPIDESARREYLHYNGIICIDDQIEIYKGRKYPAGTTGRVTKIKPYYDRYNRFICNYLYLDNGCKVSADNCRLMEV